MKRLNPIFNIPIIIIVGGLISSILVSFKSNDSLRLIRKKSIQNNTAMFTPNAEQGWSTLSEYLDLRADSVLIDIILTRNVPAQNNWNSALTIGQVRDDFKPSRERIINYVELVRVWQINILPSGNCILKLLSGEPPQGTNIVLPIQTRFKK